MIFRILLRARKILIKDTRIMKETKSLKRLPGAGRAHAQKGRSMSG
jgi:hypothetical protein